MADKIASGFCFPAKTVLGIRATTTLPSIYTRIRILRVLLFSFSVILVGISAYLYLSWHFSSGWYLTIVNQMQGASGVLLAWSVLSPCLFLRKKTRSSTSQTTQLTLDALFLVPTALFALGFLSSKGLPASCRQVAILHVWGPKSTALTNVLTDCGPYDGLLLSSYDESNPKKTPCPQTNAEVNSLRKDFYKISGYAQGSWAGAFIILVTVYFLLATTMHYIKRLKQSERVKNEQYELRPGVASDDVYAHLPPAAPLPTLSRERGVRREREPDAPPPYTPNAENASAAYAGRY